TVDWRGFLTGTNSGSITFTRAAATTAQGFTVEYSIPWSQLVSPGTAGRIIGLDIAVNDNDAPDGVRDSQIVWNGNGTGWQNPAQFDQLTLGAKPCGSLNACKTTGTTTIDGNAADWGAITATAIPYTRAVAGGGGTPSSDADSSAAFRFKWDTSNLYALVEVRDDVIAGTGNVWVNDAVELYLDGGHEHASTYDTNDYQLSIDWRNFLAGTRSNQLTFSRAVASTAQGFNVEYSVPWSALRTPTAGAVVGIDVGVNDDDGGDGVRDSQIVWHGNGTGWNDPRQFGDLVLDATLCY
ncbi:MAG: sugar-binding protein, partial [Steroidobacter sp.]